KSDRQSFARRPYAPTNPDAPTVVPLPAAGFLAPRTRRATAAPAPLLPLPDNRRFPSSVWCNAFLGSSSGARDAFSSSGDPEAPAVAVRYHGWHFHGGNLLPSEIYTIPPSRRKSQS